MPPSRPVRTAAPLLAAVAAALVACAPARDRIARQDVETLHSNVQQMESHLQARQAGVYEQIRELREEQSRLERLIEENSRAARTVGQNLERLRERTQEELDARDRTQREGAQAAADALARLGARLDAAHGELVKGFETLNENLVAMSAFEKKQEERIGKIQEQLQGQLKVVVEEVAEENQQLTRSIASLRADLDASRQETAATRQGLADLQGAMQQVAERLADAQGQLRELARRQDAARKATPAAGASHTVRAGETLTTIAARYGVSVQALMEKNKIADPDSIREGQRLALPAQ